MSNVTIGKKIIASLLAGGLVLQGCGSSVQSSTKISQIIGNDDRVEDKSELSGQRIGTLKFNNESRCTAFGTGPKQITTAYHCIAKLEERLNSGHFSFKTKETTYSVVSIDNVIEKADYAVLNIDKELPSWFEVSDYDKDAKETTLSIYSASDNNKILVNTEKYADLSKTKIIAKGYLGYTLDSIPGASGSPVFQDGRLVAVHLGAITNSNIGIIIKNAGNVDVKEIDRELTVFEISMGIIGAAVAVMSLQILYNQWTEGHTNRVFDLATQQWNNAQKIQGDAQQIKIFKAYKNVLPSDWKDDIGYIYEVRTEDRSTVIYVNLKNRDDKEISRVSVRGRATRKTCKDAVDVAAKKQKEETGNDVDPRVVEKAKCDCEKNLPEGTKICSIYNPIWTKLENSNMEMKTEVIRDKETGEISEVKTGLPKDESEAFVRELESQIAKNGFNSQKAQRVRMLASWLYSLFSEQETFLIDASMVLDTLASEKSLEDMSNDLLQKNRAIEILPAMTEMIMED